MHPGDQAAATPNHGTESTSPPLSPVQIASEDTRLAREVLATEYNVLMAALNAAWSASLTRTSLFLGVLSAAGVGFGFASQGGMESSTFLTLALLVLVLVLFLGVATFIRLVEVQRESMVYITGMNRIRHFFYEAAPSTGPYFVLPIYDDEPALYRSIGTGMRWKPPRFRLVRLTVQTQGIVGIVTAVVAAGCAALASSPAGSIVAWLVAALAFLVTMVALFVYWHRSLTDMRVAIRPIYPTPANRLSAPV
jgi:fatty acid desaturase